MSSAVEDAGNFIVETAASVGKDLADKFEAFVDAVGTIVEAVVDAAGNLIDFASEVVKAVVAVVRRRPTLLALLHSTAITPSAFAACLLRFASRSAPRAA